MSDPRIQAGLAQLPQFRALPADLLEQLAQLGCARSFRAGETIFCQGDACRGFFAVLAGSVRVYRISPDGHEQLVHHLRAAQSFGEPALLSGGVYPAHAAAIEDSELIEVEGQGFLRLFRSDQRLAAAIVAALSARLLELVGRIEELSVVGAEARLARYLLQLPARMLVKAVVVQLPMAKKDLALHLAITPETLSRLLRRWSDDGLVRVEGRGLQVLDSDGLIAIADGRRRA